MLRSLKDIEHCTVSATDGDIGTVVNFLVDDESWAVRYLVVKAGGLFTGRRVLISPISFGLPDWSAKTFPLALTMDKVMNSPGIDTELPVSRQHERAFNNYYGNSYYWGFSGMWGLGNYPAELANGGVDAASDQTSDDVHLRSADEVCGYHIQGTDAEIGHVEDFIVDDETWAVRYLVVDTGSWWTGKKVLVSPLWATRISWKERTVFLDLSLQAIKDCPEWTPAKVIAREYETQLYNYYGRPMYWSLETPPEKKALAHHGGADRR
jgi:hypothetical protein